MIKQRADWLFTQQEAQWLMELEEYESQIGHRQSGPAEESV